jgi:hypothetical protein
VLTDAQQAALPDVLTVPVVSYGFVFSYNLPELINTDYRLVLSFEIVSDIYVRSHLDVQLMMMMIALLS